MFGACGGDNITFEEMLHGSVLGFGKSLWGPIEMNQPIIKKYYALCDAIDREHIMRYDHARDVQSFCQPLDEPIDLIA